MNSPQTTASDVAAVADAIRGHARLAITTHENPDGDALGSLLAMKLALDRLGKDSVMVLFGDAPMPGEYGFMPLDGLLRRWPEDVSERVLLAVDCANESRIADPEVLGRVPLSCVAWEYRVAERLLDEAERYLAGQDFDLVRAERNVVTLD